MTNKSTVATPIKNIRQKLAANWTTQENALKPSTVYISDIFYTLLKVIDEELKDGKLCATGYVIRPHKSALTYSVKQTAKSELLVVFTDDVSKDVSWHESVRDGVRDLFLEHEFKVHIATVSKRQEEQTEDFPNSRGSWNIGEVEEKPPVTYVFDTTLKILI